MKTNVLFPSNVKTGNQFVDEAKAIYMPSKNRKRAMIVLHGFTMQKESFLDAGHMLNEHGVSSFHLDLPYHGERGMNGQGYKPRHYSGEEIRQALMQAYSDIGKSIDWLEEQGHESVAIGGYSLGAILTLLALGKEPRLKLGVAVCGGGDLADIILSSPISSAISEGLRTQGEDYKKLSEALNEVEPCNYAENIPPNRLVMINGLRDDIVNPVNSMKFISRLKNPQKIQWQDANHFSWVLDSFAIKPVLNFALGRNGQK